MSNKIKALACLLDLRGHSDLADSLAVAFKKASNPFNDAHVDGIVVTDTDLKRQLSDIRDYIPKAGSKAKKATKTGKCPNCGRKHRSENARKKCKKRAKASTEVVSYIKKEGSQYCVRSKDNPTWNGGCYNTKEEAQKRLRQVEYFKHAK